MGEGFLSCPLCRAALTPTQLAWTSALETAKVSQSPSCKSNARRTSQVSYCGWDYSSYSACLRVPTLLSASVSPPATHGATRANTKLEEKKPEAEGTTADADGPKGTAGKHNPQRTWERFSPDLFCPGRGRMWLQDSTSVLARLRQQRASSAPACSPCPASTFPWRQLLAPNGAACLQLYPDPFAKLEWH